MSPSVLARVESAILRQDIRSAFDRQEPIETSLIDEILN